MPGVTISLMDLKQTFYPESRFGGFSDVDGTIAFYTRVNSLLNPASVVVDFGCGRGAWIEDPVRIRRELRIFKGKVQRVIGLDVDPSAAGNPTLDEFYRLDGECWPLANNSVDLLVSDHVLEHLEDPGLFFGEARRVIKNNRYLCFRTPNRWGYPALFSRMVPNHEHTHVLEIVKDRVKEQDVFPTYYKANTLPFLRSLMQKNGFKAIVYGYAPEPSYLSFSKAAYWLGVVHQRFAPGFLKPVIFGFGQKI
ncbi:MAG: class I SAM-dependent methyltransferase [Omnitrophica WOR_2 bacterium]